MLQTNLLAHPAVLLPRQQSLVQTVLSLLLCLFRYCVCLDRREEIFRITELGYSHCSPRESHPYQFSHDGRLMVTIRSSLTEIGRCIVYALDHDAKRSLYPNPSLVYILSKQDSQPDLLLSRVFSSSTQILHKRSLDMKILKFT